MSEYFLDHAAKIDAFVKPRWGRHLDGIESMEARQLLHTAAGIIREQARQIELPPTVCLDDVPGVKVPDADRVNARLDGLKAMAPEHSIILDPVATIRQPWTAEAREYVRTVHAASDDELATLAANSIHAQPECPPDAPTEAESYRHFLESTFGTSPDAAAMDALVREEALAN